MSNSQAMALFLMFGIGALALVGLGAYNDFAKTKSRAVQWLIVLFALLMILPGVFRVWITGVLG